MPSNDMLSGYQQENETIDSELLAFLQENSLATLTPNKIDVELPFNLHSFDCGAPDCYVTELSFTVLDSGPFVFPKTIEIWIKEYGCLPADTSYSSNFVLIESDSSYINYYSDKLGGNLYLSPNFVYYYAHGRPETVSYHQLDSLMESRYFESEDMPVSPYQILRVVKG